MQIHMMSSPIQVIPGSAVVLTSGKGQEVIKLISLSLTYTCIYYIILYHNIPSNIGTIIMAIVALEDRGFPTSDKSP